MSSDSKFTKNKNMPNLNSHVDMNVYIALYYRSSGPNLFLALA